MTEKGTGNGSAWDFQYDPKKYFRTKSPFSKPKQSIRKHELRWPAFYVAKASSNSHTDLLLWQLVIVPTCFGALDVKATKGFTNVALRLPAQNLRQSGYLNLTFKTNRKLDWSVPRTKDILHGVLIWMAWTRTGHCDNINITSYHTVMHDNYLSRFVQVNMTNAQTDKNKENFKEYNFISILVIL